RTGDEGGAGGAAGSAGSPPGEAPTYYKDIAPIVNAHCASCHVDGGIAPFSLLDYDSASAVAAMMKVKTQAREMPPWNPDNSGDCNTYSNARWLDDNDIATIAAWADPRAPEG